MFVMRVRFFRSCSFITFRAANLLDRFIFTLEIFDIVFGLIRSFGSGSLLGGFSRCILVLFLLILFVLLALALLGFLRFYHRLLLGKQGLSVGDRDAEIIGVNFGKRQKPVTVAAEIDERRL
jgi:hypothetical protein